MNKRGIQIVVGLASVAAACSAQLPSSMPATTRAVTTTATSTTTATTFPTTTTAPSLKREPVPPPPPPDVVRPQPSTTQAVVPPPVVIAPPPPVVLPAEPLDPAIRGRMAYLAGQRLRELFQQTGTNPDDYAVVAEFIKGLQGNESSVSQERMDQAIAQLQARVRQRQAERQFADDPAFRKIAEENTQKSRAAIELMGQTAGYETAADGVLLRTDSVGTGRVVANAKSVTLAVRVSLGDGTEVSSSGPVKTATADLLPAVLDVCRGMKVGAKFRVVLPPDKAYGLAGRPPVVGPNQVVVFDLELTAAE